MLNTQAQLKQMRQWLDAKEPFLYLRLNDSECYAMFQIPGGETLGNYGVPHARWLELGNGMLETMWGVADHCRKNPSPKLLVGFYGLDRDFIDEHGAVALRRSWLYPNGLMDVIPWAVGALWYCCSYLIDGKWVSDDPCPELITGLLYSVRARKPVVLVGAQHIADARHCLGAELFVEVPFTDSWLATSRVMTLCRPLAEQGAVFIWCAGIPAKVWSWRLWSEFPQSSHIDAGSLFDAACGTDTRQWMHDREGNPKSAPHWRIYNEHFAPYIHSFIPKDGCK